MKWIAIAGTWKIINADIEKDVRNVVSEIIKHGDAIVTSGAVGVNFIAIDEALKHDPHATSIKIYLPATLEMTAKHYREIERDNIITAQQLDTFVSQLEHIQLINHNAILEEEGVTSIDKHVYLAAQSKVIAQADGLVAFHVNNSEGTQDAINLAEKKNIAVKKFNYTILVK
jgi:hypothetical protein